MKLIDADKLKEALPRTVVLTLIAASPMAISDQAVDNAMNKLNSLIDEQPTARPSEAHWHKVKRPLTVLWNYVCDGCKVMEVNPTKFCPHCGASMTIGDEWEDDIARSYQERMRSTMRNA